MSRRRGIVVEVECVVNDNNNIEVTYTVTSNTTGILNPTIHGNWNLDHSFLYYTDEAEEKIKSDLAGIQRQIADYYVKREEAFDIVEKLSGNYKITRTEIERT